MAIAVLVTIPEAEAEGLAKTLVEERVCACVNIVKGMKSFFWWKDKLSEAQEALLIIKTKDALLPKLQRFIKNNHSYTVPEIISFKIETATPEYLEWLNKEASATTY